MKKYLLLLIMLSNFSMAYAASFDCSKRSGYVENEICTNDQLGQFDEQMASLYKKYMKTLKHDDAKILLREQREWLKRRKTDCKYEPYNSSCLISMYKRRISELSARIKAPNLPSLNDVDSFCHKIANATPTQRRKIGGGVGDINNDGVGEKIMLCASGSGGGMPGQKCEMYMDKNNNYIQILGTRAIMKRYGAPSFQYVGAEGKAYKLYSYDSELKEPAYLSYIAPNNTEYVMCEFDNSPIQKMIVNPNELTASGICSSLIRKYEGKKDCKGISPLECLMMNGSGQVGHADKIKSKAIDIDYDNDGVVENLIVQDYSYSQSHECMPNRIDVSDKLEDQNGLLNKLQNIEQKQVYENCGAVSNEFSKYGQTYYFVQKIGNTYRISYINEGRVHNVCEYIGGYDTVVGSVGVPVRQ